MNNDFLNYLDGGYKGISQIRTKFPNEVNNIIEFNKNFKITNWGQMLFNYINNISELPKCKCSNLVKFIKFNRGYTMHCSVKCKGSDENIKNRIKQGFLKKYGVENPLQSPEVQEKRRKIFFEKHGVEHQSQLAEVREKRKQTCLKKFGTATNLLCEETKNKIRQTNLEKFGVEHNSQSLEIKEKKKQKCLEKFGVEYDFQSSDFKEKSKQMCLKKFGVEHTSLSKEIRNKQLETKRKSKLIQIAKQLNIKLENLLFENNILTIKNYCNLHNEFSIGINNLYQRWFKYNKKICTKCYPLIKQVSANEIEIKLFIESLNINYIDKCKTILKNNFEIDIYLPDYKLGIEFDGLYWHSDLFKDKNYHLNKTEECEQQGIQLLHIFEDEWINKKEIVKSIIKSKIGIVGNKIFARKTVVKEIDITTCNNFLNDNHIQGAINSKIKIGLFYNDELVSIMTFGKKRIAMGNKISIEGEYEMYRFCNKLNTSIIGGSSKLINYFIKTYNPKSVLTFADRRYSQGNLYKQLQFKFNGNTEPNYWYYKKNEMIKQHRFKFRKDVLVKEGFNKNKTEFEIMNDRDYYRIYDCGNMKFEMILN
jgi:hypothetical protein